MASSSSTIDIPDVLLTKVRKFRLTPSKAPITAQVYKIDKKTLTLELEEELLTGLTSVEDLIEELPENSPRFLIVNYKLNHRDGRVSYPLFLLYWAPQTSSLDQSTLYASALSNFSVKSDVAKVVDVRDGDLSSKQLDERLGA
ncbi:Actin-binding, cofilin/tropomyosin type [Kalmanozyma brasiliensis GHG001]|uniref:ADF-H domain-containing protein n=1 Tax=Kalmanozyma brasiliensis (strain GHG001) TaxID=1365824 RepID=V5GJL3_KALBG|nr:Actin-binding, cofilin/tropomyosin type [Kalmanozyma brasiliensis GHG001]EST06147.1 Actin-binding, cofilin/tropomyosin type [Kalmanozyma brasiliensis GHG001]